MTPSSGSLSASPSAKWASERFFSRTIGRAGDLSSISSSGETSHVARASSTVATMTANALPSRFLRERSFSSASVLVASQAKWNPPRPFTAKMPPCAKTSTDFAIKESDSSRLCAHEMSSGAFEMMKLS